MQKKTIAIMTAPEGHESIAAAIKESLEKKYTVVTFLKRDDFFSTYVPIYQLFPSIFKIPFNLSKNTSALQSITKFFDYRYKDLIRKFQIEHTPSLYISTYFMYNPSIEKMCEITRTPFINVITDPKSFHPMIVSPQATMNVCFDQTAKQLCSAIADASHPVALGWFVREQYEKKMVKSAVYHQLKLPHSTLTFLIASGSEGTSLILKILPAFLQTKTSLTIIVACGNNKTLFSSIRAFGRMMKKVNKNLRIVPLKFTPNLHLYMQAADLVIGKAGPNTLFESVATLTPFFAITHISGQEDGNLDIIREYKLGYVEEHPMKAAKLLKHIIAHPHELESFQPHLQKMAEYNRHSKVKLLEIVDSLLENTHS